MHLHTSRSPIRERPLHWCIILLSLLFVLLLVVESVAFLVLGAWHLTTWRLRTTLLFAGEVRLREVIFGVLLVLIGSAGVLASILGLVGFFTLRPLLLHAFALCLWLVMIVGVVTGITGIIFASQMDVYTRHSAESQTGDYAEEKFMLRINGGVTVFMSLTLLLGIIIVRCLTDGVNICTAGPGYQRA